MKYLLVLAVVLVAVYVWRNNRLTADEDAAKAAARKKPKLRAPTIMVACLECGTHLPESEAVKGRQGAYCCAEHRQQREGRGS